MIRPRLRPTISRRIKYIGIAPHAERKLQHEARRGSHDLRRLVGHANFLDVLVETLDIHDEDEIADSASSHSEESSAQSETKGVSRELSGEDTASDEAWSDSSDDDDHALMRTASGAAIVDIHVAKVALDDTKAAIAESGDDFDYFSLPRHTEPVFPVDAVTEDSKNAGVSVAEIASPLSDLMSEFGYGSSLSSTSSEKSAASSVGVSN